MKAIIFAIILISYIAGTIGGFFLHKNSGLWLFIGLVLAISAFFAISKKIILFTVLAMAIFLLAAARYQFFESSFYQENQSLQGKERKIEAYVSDLPKETETGQRAFLQLISINGQEKKGKIQGYFNRYPTLEYGQKITFTSTIKIYSEKRKMTLIKSRVVGEVTVKEYATGETPNFFSLRLKKLLYDFRHSINSSLQRSFPFHEANLASGLILGEKAFFTPDYKQALQDSGTSHIVALSGYNITIILSFFFIFTRRLSRLMNLFIPGIFAILFIVMTGADASIVRVGIMGMMPVVARYFGRNTNNFLMIVFAGAVMILINPFILLFDIGFQLSFTALIGIIYLSPILISLTDRWPNSISTILSQTLSAQIMTLPLLLFYFGKFSVVAPIANILVLSLIPLAMLFSFLVALIGLIVPLATYLLIPIGYLILKVINTLIVFFGNLSLSSFESKIDNVYVIILIYFVLIDLIFITRKRVNLLLLKREGRNGAKR